MATIVKLWKNDRFEYQVYHDNELIDTFYYEGEAISLCDENNWDYTVC